VEEWLSKKEQDSPKKKAPDRLKEWSGHNEWVGCLPQELVDA
jgi:hypothetical protein